MPQLDEASSHNVAERSAPNDPLLRLWNGVVDAFPKRSFAVKGMIRLLWVIIEHSSEQERREIIGTVADETVRVATCLSASERREIAETLADGAARCGYLWN